MARSLIVNADDFGLTEGVSRGIIQAHREGLVTSTTFMVNLPWADQMAPLLAEAPDLGVGVHLNLTTGAPLLPPAQVDSLVGTDGRFSRSLWRVLTRIRPAEALGEWSAQVERAIALLGRTPTHLDTHRYLQGYPPLAEVMVQVAKTYAIPAVRALYPNFIPPGTFGPWNPAPLVLERYLRRSLAIVRESGLRCPGGVLAGDFDLLGLLRRLERVGEGVTELVCHPGQVDEALEGLSSLREQRAVELAALAASEARERLQERGIQLIHFGHLGS